MDMKIGMRDETMTRLPARQGAETKAMKGLSKFFVSSLIPLVSSLFFVSSLISHPSSLAFAAFRSKDAGSSAAAFLKIGAGARPTAMGDAFTGVADDVNAIYWNTAGLSTLRKAEFVAMRANLFQDLTYHFFAFALPLGSKQSRTENRFGTLALGLNNLSIEDLERRTEDTDKPDSTFSSNDSAYTLAYSYRVPLGITEGIHLGLGLKYLRQTLAGNTASAFATDLGSLYRFQDMPLALGLSLQNIGTKVKFKEESDSLPLTMKVGASYLLGREWNISGRDKLGESEDRSGLLMAMDLNVPRDNDPTMRIGTDFTRGWSEGLSTSIRGSGYQVGKSGQGQFGSFGFSAGFGITYKVFSFDFAWTPAKDLGTTYRYSVRMRF